MTDLEPGETYEIVVIARNGNGDETSSEPKYITIGPDSGTNVYYLNIHAIIDLFTCLDIRFRCVV